MTRRGKKNPTLPATVRNTLADICYTLCEQTLHWLTISTASHQLVWTISSYGHHNLACLTKDDILFMEHGTR